MMHDDVLALLPRLVRGRLDEPDRARVREHLEGCTDCAEAMSTLELLATPMKGAPAATPGHPSVQEVVDFAVQRDRLDPARALQIARHVERCGECRSEVKATKEALRQSEAAGTGVPHQGHRTWPPSAWASLAAAVVVIALLAYPAARGLAERQKVARPAPSGVVLAPVLAPGARGVSNEVPVVKIEPGQRLAVLPVDLVPPTSSDEQATIVFEIARGDAVVSSMTRPLEEVSRAVRQGRVVLLEVPAARLEAGEYEVRVDVLDNGSRRRVSGSLFRVVR